MAAALWVCLPPRGKKGLGVSWSDGTLLKLFLSPNATVLTASAFMATTVHATKHRGHRPLFGGPGAVKLPLRRENLLPLALPHVLGPKIGLIHEIVGLEGHKAC